MGSHLRLIGIREKKGTTEATVTDGEEDATGKKTPRTPSECIDAASLGQVRKINSASESEGGQRAYDGEGYV